MFSYAPCAFDPVGISASALETPQAGRGNKCALLPPRPMKWGEIAQIIGLERPLTLTL